MEKRPPRRARQHPFLLCPVDSSIPGTPRARLLVQRHVGRDEERGRTAQLLHRGPVHAAQFLAGVRHQLSHVRDDRCVLDRPCAPWGGRSRASIGPLSSACGRRWEPYLIPDRTQSLVDNLLILIALASHHLPKNGGCRFFCLFTFFFFFCNLDERIW